MRIVETDGTVGSSVAVRDGAADGKGNPEMQARPIGIVAVSATLSTAAAIVFWHLVLPQVLGSDALPDIQHLQAWIWTVPPAFGGSFIASCIFVARGKRSLGWAFAFIVLCDVFAVLIYCIGTLPQLFFNAMRFGGVDYSYVRALLDFVLAALAIPIFAITLGNVTTGGVGFVMALPALAWLWFTHHPAATNMPMAELDKPLSR